MSGGKPEGETSTRGTRARETTRGERARMKPEAGLQTAEGRLAMNQHDQGAETPIASRKQATRAIHPNRRSIQKNLAQERMQVPAVPRLQRCPA